MAAPLLTSIENEFCDAKDTPSSSKSACDKHSSVNKRIPKCFGFGKKVQPNPCKDKHCGNNCALNFTEADRNLIHTTYWAMGSRQRQRDWLLSCIQRHTVKRRRVEPAESRRAFTYKYHIKLLGETKEVCQQFMLKTLDISQMTLRYTCLNASANGFAKEDGRGRHEPANKTQPSAIQDVCTFIEQLLAEPFVYCGQVTTRKYLPAELRNVSHLYQHLYEPHCKSCEPPLKPVSLGVFRKIFTKYNIGFHLPETDNNRIGVKVEILSDDEHSAAAFESIFEQY